MRTITNFYGDAQVLNLSPEGDRGPFLVIQQGVAPSETVPRERLFILRPDGQWVDFNAYVCQGQPALLDEIVFETMQEVMETFAELAGKPQVAKLPIDEAGLKAWVSRQESSDPIQNAHSWARQFKERHRK